MACKCLGTHTGDIDDGIGSYYTAPEAADNLTDEVSVGYRNDTTAMTYEDNLALASDDGCGTLIETYEEEGALVVEATTMASYVGGKPDDNLHKALGGSYGAGALAANVSLEKAESMTNCKGETP